MTPQTLNSISTDNHLSRGLSQTVVILLVEPLSVLLVFGLMRILCTVNSFSVNLEILLPEENSFPLLELNAQLQLHQRVTLSQLLSHLTLSIGFTLVLSSDTTLYHNFQILDQDTEMLKVVLMFGLRAHNTQIQQMDLKLFSADSLSTSQKHNKNLKTKI